MKRLCFLTSLVFMGLSSIAQISKYDTEDGFNPFSTKNIHKSDIMWKKTIVRAVDLRERQNEPIFSKDKEITRIMIEAVKAGLIQAYATDSLSLGKVLTTDEFLEKTKIPSAEAQLTEEELAFQQANEGSDESDPWGSAATDVVATGGNYFYPKDLYQMQLIEDMIFDKQRSVMYYDILAVKMFVPADHPDNIRGIESPIASFSYKELVEKVFKNNPKAIWFNPQNDSEHRTLDEAFELRLFSSYIVKVSNPQDAFLVDVYGGDPAVGILASQWKAFELLEFEHNLWEF